MSYPVDYALDEGQRRFWLDLSAGRRGPKIVCLCGSTRFWRDFQEQGLRETMAGNIVLSIGAARGRDDDGRSFGGYVPASEYDAAKEVLDQLHLWKVALADEVLVLNVGGYVGESTAREIAHAKSLNKPIRYLEPEEPAAPKKPGEHGIGAAGIPYTVRADGSRSFVGYGGAFD